MYEHFYNLKQKPFNMTPDPEFLFFTEKHKEAFAHLVYGIRERRGFIEITGEIGAGKTTLCRALLNEFDEETKLALILNPFLNDMELLKAINEELYIDATGETKKQLLDELNRYLIDQHAAGHNVVLVIDEAQNLPPATLEQIRIISNLETVKAKLIQIVLVGQPELRDKLSRPELKQLNQRITVRYHIHPLSHEETRDYIRHRLRVAGDEGLIEFTDKAARQVYKFTHGVPRMINILCDHALLSGFVEERYDIDEDLIKKAWREIEGDQLEDVRALRRRIKRYGWAYGAAAAIVLIAAGIIIGQELTGLRISRQLEQYVGLSGNQPSLEQEGAPLETETTQTTLPAIAETEGQEQPPAQQQIAEQPPPAQQPEEEASSPESPPAGDVSEAKEFEPVILKSEKEPEEPFEPAIMGMDADVDETLSEMPDTELAENDQDMAEQTAELEAATGARTEEGMVASQDLQEEPVAAGPIEMGTLVQSDRGKLILMQGAPSAEEEATGTEPIALGPPLQKEEPKLRSIEDLEKDESLSQRIEIGEFDSAGVLRCRLPARTRAAAILSLAHKWTQQVEPLEELFDKYADVETKKWEDEAFQTYGLTTISWSTNLAMVKAINLPAVAEVYEKALFTPRYVMITELDDEWVTIADPRYGLREYRPEEFSKIWFGRLTILAPLSVKPRGIIGRGSSGEEVRMLQARLKKLEYFDPEPSGFFGEYTEQQVKRFQEHHRIRIDGLVGLETNLVLFSRLAGTDAPRLDPSVQAQAMAGR